jgi:hypothetical protein
VCGGRGGKVIALLDSWLLYGTSAYLFVAGKAFSIGTQSNNLLSFELKGGRKGGFSFLSGGKKFLRSGKRVIT